MSLFVLIDVSLCSHSCLSLFSFVYLFVLIRVSLCPHSCISLFSFVFLFVLIRVSLCSHSCLSLSSFVYLFVLIRVSLRPHSCISLFSFVFLFALIRFSLCSQSCLSLFSVVSFFVLSRVSLCPHSCLSLFSVVFLFVLLSLFSLFSVDQVFQDVEFSGTVFVNTDFDNDIFGFIFGYQGYGKFYLFSWKQTDQVFWEGQPFRARAKPVLNLKVGATILSCRYGGRDHILCRSSELFSNATLGGKPRSYNDLRMSACSHFHK